MAEKWVFTFGELCKDDNDRVGKKCANLGEMTSMGMRVPPGFAISVDGYKKFMASTGLKGKIEALFASFGDELKNSVAMQMEASKVVKAMIQATPMPEAMADEIRRAYGELCDCCGDEVSVAVRSSGAVSMPGQMETYLNVQGADNVIRRVIEVWESSFNTRAIAFRLEKGMPVDQAPIGVGILKMVNAKSAGVVLTVVPSTADLDRVVVEGNWGLGESVVSGDITPDSFLVHKDTLAIESHVSKKTVQVIFNGAGTAKAEVPLALQEVPCLDQREILEIVRVAKGVEKYFGVPQDMEWVVDRDLPFPDNLYWVQARPAKYVPKKQGADLDYLVDQMARMLTM